MHFSRIRSNKKSKLTIFIKRTFMRRRFCSTSMQIFSGKKHSKGSIVKIFYGEITLPGYIGHSLKTLKESSARLKYKYYDHTL